MRPCECCGLIHPVEPVCPYEWPRYTPHRSPELQVPSVQEDVDVPHREEAEGGSVCEVRPGGGARNCPCCDGRVTQEGGFLRCSECHMVLED